MKTTVSYERGKVLLNKAENITVDFLYEAEDQLLKIRVSEAKSRNDRPQKLDVENNDLQNIFGTLYPLTHEEGDLVMEIVFEGVISYQVIEGFMAEGSCDDAYEGVLSHSTDTAYLRYFNSNHRGSSVDQIRGKPLLSFCLDSLWHRIEALAIDLPEIFLLTKGKGCE